MLGYSRKDAALLVALDSLQQRIADREPDDDGYVKMRMRPRAMQDFTALVDSLVDRGWASKRFGHDGILLARLTRVGKSELHVFRERSSAAAARARGEQSEEWRP